MQSSSAVTSIRSGYILDESQLPTEVTARRMRERYIAARFLQFPQPAHALRNTSSIMAWARQLMDDDQPRQAAELLQLALEENHAQQPLWLFLIELAYLGKDPGLFVELNDSFKERFPRSEAIPVMDAMGKKLLPADPRFSHAVTDFVLPDWSTPESELRDELRQKKLHLALVDAMAFHSSR